VADVHSYPPGLLHAAAQAAHKALNDAYDGWRWHYSCAHPAPGKAKECWKGDRATKTLTEDVIPAVLDVLAAAGWRFEPDVLRNAADDLDVIAERAMRDGRENAGLDAYAGVVQVVGWLRARAGLTPTEARRKDQL
jgi:hypothetical protein